ncbi:hypothetical protein [Luteimonas huabeiensis]|uniref:hypothetical protein n=1 Tax=Luteimonas huabeiensis TaxID=1244513 RepID=UPI0004669C0B|nr:hypothetical protein [Luteimonas huabeiensis]
MALLALAIAFAALLAAAAWLRARRRRADRHRRALAGVLDAADAFEARLRAARAEIEAAADRDRDRDPVREAMQEMLRQRLWLQRHGGEASPERLERVRDAIDGARARIDRQLDRLERARAH